MFARPRLEAVLRVSSPAEREPTSGLVVLSVTAQASEPVPARLTLKVDGVAVPGFVRTVSLGPDPQAFWLALHGHLLPDGPVTVALELRTHALSLLAHATVRLNIRNDSPVAELVRASLQARGAPLVVDGAFDSRLYDYEDPSLTAWFDRDAETAHAYLAGLKARGEATAEEIEALTHFAREGFIILPGAIPPDLVARVRADVDTAAGQTPETLLEGLADLHLQYGSVREVWLHPSVLRMLELIFGAPARPSRSVVQAVGAEQAGRQDTIHLTPYPAGRMCGVWTALEDVAEGAGEPVVFPRSHRLPRVYMSSVDLPKVTGDDWGGFRERVGARWGELLQDRRIEGEAYRPKAGTVLIAHENLMHAVQARADGAGPRRWLRSHYFAEGALAYSDSTGLPAAVYQGELPKVDAGS